MERNNSRPSSTGQSVVASTNTIEQLLKFVKGERVEEYDLFSLNGLIKKFAGVEQNDTKISQLRRFYDDIVTLDDNQNFGDSEIDSRLTRIIPLARYSHARGNLDENLRDFLDKSIGVISKERDSTRKRDMLSRMRRVMEAIVAYKKEVKRGDR